MWNGKLKAITFSFDDGVYQDEEIIKILDKYGLKATFNLNSALSGTDGSCFLPDGHKVERYIIDLKDIKERYKNHEVACHTAHHMHLPSLTDEEIIKEVNDDQKALSDALDYEVIGMAYPCAPPNCDQRVAKVLREKTKIKYSRDFPSSYSFDLQDDLLLFKPTVFWGEECLYELADKFLKLKPEEPKIFYIWGHTYEIDCEMERVSLEKFDAFCKYISNKDDIFYGTNKEVLLDK